MGQKVHPYGFRLGINKPWKSRWFVERGYDRLLVEDVLLRRELKEKLKSAGFLVCFPACASASTVSASTGRFFSATVINMFEMRR